jgi:outer membrane protein assembly factor BamB/predicted Ser/Thr protein kinase
MDTERFAKDAGKRQQGSDGTLQVGAVLQGRYKITGVLGVGGMGSVYQARDMNFPNVTRHVAVKEMLNLASDPGLREMTLRNFEREANILAELSHPAIPKIFDYFSNKDRAYLVMEYINGYDMEALVNRTPNFLPIDMVEKWAVQLCDVLQYLHTHKPEPIIFRDVKPSNVMIDNHGNVRLIDFGIAKMFQSNQKGTMIGTEGYSPPEQYRGEASPAGDVYATGATFHHVLTRRDPRLEPPFSFAERPIREANPEIPPELEAVVLKALAYEPTARYSSAQAMKEAIEQIGKRSAPTFNIGSAAEPGSEADELAEAGKVVPRWKFQCEDEIRSTPTVYKNFVYVGAYDNNLYAIDATTGEFKWKYATEGGIVGTPQIDADDNLILFGSEDHYLHAVDLRTGKINWTFKTNRPLRGTVNATLGHAFFGSDDGTLYAVRLTTGRLVWKHEAGSPIRSKPAVTSERVVVGTEEGDVLGLDLSGVVKWRFKAKRSVTSSPAIDDDIAYFGSADWHVYAVDVTNGYVVWRSRLNKPILSSPLVIGRNLYVGCADNSLYALDVTANGREMWKFESQGQIVSSPVHLNGALYFGSADKNVYSIDVKKGKLRWSFETGGVIASSAAITDSLLYIGSTDHFLYALNP